MKTDRIDTGALDHEHPGGQAHKPAHGHAHAHGHEHHHSTDHDHSTHAYGPAPLLPKPVSAPGASLLMTSALLRFAGAIGLNAMLWAAVAWALSGTP